LNGFNGRFGAHTGGAGKGVSDLKFLGTSRVKELLLLLRLFVEKSVSTYPYLRVRDLTVTLHPCKTKTYSTNFGHNFIFSEVTQAEFSWTILYAASQATS
jgi:hypothetical protein